MEGYVLLFTETKGIPSIWESFLCNLQSLFIPHSEIHTAQQAKCNCAVLCYLNSMFRNTAPSFPTSCDLSVRLREFFFKLKKTPNG